MKPNENENKKPVVRLTETGAAPAETQDAPAGFARFKKPLLFGLMGIVFLCCMYLIFAPSAGESTKDSGLNDSVPQATGAGLQSDKQKAYEAELFEQKEQQKRQALQSLADYWNTGEPDSSRQIAGAPTIESVEPGPQRRAADPALSSYRDAQNTLGSFYRDDRGNENSELRKELSELKMQLARQESSPGNTLDNQIALMEKSYKLAAKYLPGGAKPEAEGGGATVGPSEKEQFVAIGPSRREVVSALGEPGDSHSAKTRGEFYTVGQSGQNAGPRNGIRACVDKTQTIEKEGDVRIRLLEPALAPGRTIPQGAVLTAAAKIEGGRLQLKVSSIELAGNIIPVDLTIYDIDGQQGLFVPSSAEMEAVKEMASNMGKTSGTSIMMTQNAGQQIAGDLSKGFIQGLSGYLSKKASTKRVTLKAGHRLFLVSKK